MAGVCPRCEHEHKTDARYCLHCGALLSGEQRPDPWVGRTLADRYLILAVLGEGGMGKVYRAEQKMGAATRNVAVKMLRPDLSRDERVRARFLRECATVIQLSHPNTVSFYDFGEEQDALFIVMEYIEGESLGQVLKRGPLAAERATAIVSQVCASLQEAHEQGIVHRDLKPDNILLTSRGGREDFVKVLDFGIAKQGTAEDHTHTLTQQGAVVGTPPYMSPEQFRGEELDGRSDVYSLAVTAYEMLTGRLPFDARTPWEWATHHLTSAPIDIDSLVEPGSIALEKRQVVMAGLAKDKGARPASAEAFALGFGGTVGIDSLVPSRTSLASAAAAADAASAPSGLEDTVQLARPAHRRGWLPWAMLAVVAPALWLWWGGNAAQEPVLEQPNAPPAASPEPTTADASVEQRDAAAPDAAPSDATTPDAAATDVQQAQPARTTNTGAAKKAQRDFDSALKRSAFKEAAATLQSLIRLQGRSHPSVRTRRSTLSSRAGNRVGVLLQMGQCGNAQALYRALARVGAEKSAKAHFGDWCKLP